MAGMLALLIAVSGCASSARKSEPVYFPKPPSPPRVVLLKAFNSLADLTSPRVSFLDMIRGQSPGPFVSTPAGIAYAGGHLYICDTDLNVVHRWNLGTGEADRLGTGEDALGKPVAVAVDENGQVYVADTGRSAVMGFDNDGGVFQQFRVPDVTDYRPVAVAVRGTDLFVADIARHRIDVFSTTDGGYVKSIGKAGSKEGDFYFPMGLAASGKDQLLVSDMMNGRVQVLDAGYQVTQVIGQPGDRYGDMGKPRGLAVASDGTIAVADSEFAHVHLFDSAGRCLMLFGGETDAPGGTPMPVGVAVASSLPAGIASLVPPDFNARFFLFTSSSIGEKRISLFAVGQEKP